MDLSAIEKAHKRIKNSVHNIPLELSATFSRMSGAQVYLKYENLQKTGSFKVRGAYNKVSALRESGAEIKSVIASSAGNHAQGLAYSAEVLGIPATIVMPESAPMAKIEATRSYGARVVLSGRFYDESYEKALEIQKETGAEFIHAFNDLDIIAGQGTIGIEILKDLPTTDAVIVPAGGGGLLAGVSACIKAINPRIKVIGVQAEGADAIVQSFRNKRLSSSKGVMTIADGIAVKNPGEIPFGIICKNVDEMITVSDAQISAAILLLLERCKQVVEPSGAAAVAAILSKKLDLQDKKVVGILSGGNIDVSFIHKIIERGLLERGRQLQIRTIINDTPGSLKQFCDVVSENGVNILQIQHDRLSADIGLNEAIIHAVLELKNREHGKELIAALESVNYKVTVL